MNVQGIALSPSGRERMIYYSPLSSTRLYSLPTSVLREPGRDIGGSVNDLGMKMGVSDGMIMDSSGVLYFGILSENGVARWDSHRDPFASGQRIMARVSQVRTPALFNLKRKTNKCHLGVDKTGVRILTHVSRSELAVRLQCVQLSVCLNASESLLRPSVWSTARRYWTKLAPNQPRGAYSRHQVFIASLIESINLVSCSCSALIGVQIQIRYFGQVSLV